MPMIEKKMEIRYALNLQDGAFTLTEKEFQTLQREMAQFKLVEDWRVLALTGRKIDAIRRFRELTDAGVLEAKDAVLEFARLSELEEAKLFTAYHEDFKAEGS